MFTIKHIKVLGDEEIIQVETVRFEPGMPGFISQDGKTGQTGTPPTVWVGERPLSGGTVFVMNDMGKTVSRYDLGASPVPYVPYSITTT